jgi:hypothetical protein
VCIGQLSRLIVSQDPFVVPGLPERATRCLPVREAGHLFRVLHKSGEIGIFHLGHEEQVNVVRHQAVRNNCESELARSFQKFRFRVGCDCVVIEDGFPEGRAGCDEVPLEPDIAHAY